MEDSLAGNWRITIQPAFRRASVRTKFRKEFEIGVRRAATRLNSRATRPTNKIWKEDLPRKEGRGASVSRNRRSCFERRAG